MSAAEPTQLSDELNQVEMFVRRFVVLSEAQTCAVVLWVAHTHALAVAAATPYLAISSAEMESGKTRLLEVLSTLVANPWFTGRTTTAALTRKIDKAAPTLLLDESDPAFNGDKEYAEALRGVLNTGYRRGGAVTVCIGQGATLDVRDFSTFCAKAIAGIGRLPDTVQSRAIPIVLKKRLATEPVERFREAEAREAGRRLAEALNAAVEPRLEELDGANPELPDDLSDRAQDVWEPLFAIADAAGEDWPARARATAVELSGPQEPDEGTLGVRLLAHLHDVFGEEEQRTTQELLGLLRDLEEAPGGGWNEGEGIRPRELANKLRPYGIRSHDLRTEEGTKKGYRRGDFEDAWGRYLPVPPDSKRDIRDIGTTEPKTPALQARQDPPASRIERAEKPHGNADVADVADRTGGSKGDEALEAFDRRLDEARKGAQ